MDIREDQVGGHCYFSSSVKEGQMMFSMLDQKRVKAVQSLQEKCGHTSDENFVHTLECNTVPGVDFGRRDVKIANERNSYSEGSAMGKMKHPRKGKIMERISESILTPVPSQLMEHYKNVHLDMDLLFINKVAFFVCTSRDIDFINCSPVLNKTDKRVMNALRQVVTEYKDRGFKVVTASGDGAFGPMTNCLKEQLGVVLTTCDADSHVPRAENAIRFIKKRV